MKITLDFKHIVMTCSLPLLIKLDRISYKKMRAICHPNSGSSEERKKAWTTLDGLFCAACNASSNNGKDERHLMTDEDFSAWMHGKSGFTH